MNLINAVWLSMNAFFITWNLKKLHDFGFDTSSNQFLMASIGYGCYLAVSIGFFIKSLIRKPPDLDSILRIYDCDILSRDENKFVHELVDKISTEEQILRPEIFSSDLIKNNALSISGKNRNLIIISKDFLKYLISPQLGLIIKHEMYHLKYFTTNKFEMLKNQPEFSLRNNALSVLVLFGITIVLDFWVDSYLIARDGSSSWSFSLIVLFFLFLLYIGYAIFFFYYGRTPVTKTPNLGELLSDAFALLDKKNFDNFRNIVNVISPTEFPQKEIQFQECFIRKHYSKKSLRSREKVQRERQIRNEKKGIIKYISSLFEWEFQTNNENNWVDILHGRSTNEEIYYDPEVRLEFFNDLQIMCQSYVNIATTSKTKSRSGIGRHDTFQGDISLLVLWNYLFNIHKIPKDVLNKVFSFIQKNENRFNLVECAKEIGQSEFITLLAVLRHITHRNIVLKWRYPTKFNFDY